MIRSDYVQQDQSLLTAINNGLPCDSSEISFVQANKDSMTIFQMAAELERSLYSVQYIKRKLRLITDSINSNDFVEDLPSEAIVLGEKYKIFYDRGEASKERDRIMNEDPFSWPQIHPRRKGWIVIDNNKIKNMV